MYYFKRLTWLAYFLLFTFQFTSYSAIAGHQTIASSVVNTQGSIQSTAEEIPFIDPDIHSDSSHYTQYYHGFIVGGLTLLALVMLVIFANSRNKSALFLFGYFMSRALLLLIILQESTLYLFFNAGEFRATCLVLLPVIALIFMVYFILDVFKIKNKYSLFYQRIKHFSWASICVTLFSLFFGVQVSLVVSLSIQCLIYLFLIALGIMLIKERQPLAILLITTLVIETFALAMNITKLPLSHLIYLDHDIVLIGLFFWPNALLVLFLASKYLFLQLQSQTELQEQALASAISAKKANDELLALHQDNQEELEAHVQERTLELHIALQELESSNRELELKNTQDDLTGLYNRRFYDQKIMAEYRRSKRNLTPLSLVLIDIDHFKVVNDTYGHLAGDQCLAWLGKAIKARLKRTADLGCRYGGEEFCLILPDTDSAGAVALAENLRADVSNEPCVYHDLSIKLTISSGVATYLQQGDIMPEQLFEGADKALYKAKGNGRNQTQVHQFP